MVPNRIDEPGVVPLELVLATAAKIIASGVFLSGREIPEILRHALPHAFVLHHVDQSITSLLRIDVDRGARCVRVSAAIDRRAARDLVHAYREAFPDLVADWDLEVGSLIARAARPAVAQCAGDQGCVILPDSGSLYFQPVALRSSLGAANECDWPMGDRQSRPATDRGLRERVAGAVEAVVVDGDAATAAVVVVHRGEVVAEHYRRGFDSQTRLENWSMGKSLTATLIGRLIHDGYLDLDQPAPVPGWTSETDPRGTITVRHLLQMTSGVRFSGDLDPRESWSHGTSDHFYVYSAPIDVYDFAASHPLEFPPGEVGRYRNCDPLLLGYLARHIVEDRLDEDYLSWPQRTLFDRIGVRRHVLETDCYGNFIMPGFVYGTARDWARLGLLYLRDGCWEGERLLPQGWSEFVSTPAPGWARPEYGALFWLNRTGDYDLPTDAYYMSGYGEQRVFIVPSADLVVVRMGLTGDGTAARESVNRLARGVMRAIDASGGDTE